LNMASKAARIRPLLASDVKHTLFAIGKANFESLAVANRKAYSHPLLLGLWLLLSFSFIHFMNWWPSNYRGYLGILGYLKPLPAFASVAVPLMFFVDWNNRPHFEELTQKALREKDLHDVMTYYSKSKASGFWILEYGDRFIGLIALDATKAKETRKGIIRHFYVEEEYRKTNIQDDLLHHAVQDAFDKSPALELIEGVDAVTLIPYIHDSYQRAGFRLSQEYDTVGSLGRWKYFTTRLHRKDWKKSALN